MSLHTALPGNLASRVGRSLFFGFGLLAVGLGYVGVVVPGMPSTIFFILALWAFKRSSPRFESWLLNHRLFGHALRNWDRDRSITRRGKIFAVSAIWISIGISSLLLQTPWVVALLLTIAACISAYLLTRPTAPPKKSAPAMPAA
jgi:uncharacterized protein